MASTKAKNRISANGHANGEAAKVVPLKKLNVQTFSVTIRGLTPLVVHRFGEKARKVIESKGDGKPKEKRGPRSPVEDYKSAFYVISGEPGTKSARYGIPASGIKKAMVAACAFVDGIAMTFARGAFHVLEDAAGLVELKYKSVSMRSDIVRLNTIGNPPDMRYRPEFKDWSATVRIMFNATVITPEQIVDLLSVAGFHIGLCEYRPQKNGSWGTFEVVSQ